MSFCYDHGSHVSRCREACEKLRTHDYGGVDLGSSGMGKCHGRLCSCPGDQQPTWPYERRCTWPGHSATRAGPEIDRRRAARNRRGCHVCGDGGAHQADCTLLGSGHTEGSSPKSRVLVQLLTSTFRFDHRRRLSLLLVRLRVQAAHQESSTRRAGCVGVVARQ